MRDDLGEWMSTLLGGEDGRDWDWNDLLYEIDSYTEFENLVAELWEDLGYETTLTNDGADGGYDILAERSRFIRGPDVVVIEVKWWEEDEISRPDVQKLEGVRSAKDADTAVFVTSSLFGRRAKQWAEDKERIKLLNGRRLVNRLNESSLEPPEVEY